MPAELSPKKLQQSVNNGFARLRNFRNARLMFLRNYVGQYYDRDSGPIGTEPLNLIFNAIRILVPNIVMNFPTHKVTSRFLAHRDYAELLGLALQQHDKSIKIRDVYRRAVVDAIFTMGILKTGLCESDSVYAFDEYNRIDVGEVYTEAVDFDNFVVDPNSKDHMFRDAAYMGDRLCVPRQKLLDSGLYRNDLIERLPSAADIMSEDRASDLSMRNRRKGDIYDLQDEVEIVELWVPDANATLTVPGTKDVILDDYLRVDDFYGPDTGPYTFLALTPPVPGNPIPVPLVGVWNDLHILANRMARKIIEQAQRQKDIVGYRRSAADDAQEALDARDGEAVAMDDPDGIKVHSFGGQQNSNETHLARLQAWFNMMAANPQMVGGERFDAESATEARILANNANVGLEDMKDLVYQMAADEAGKRALYFHTDPLINLPLIRRTEMPAQYAPSPVGPVMMQPPQLQDVQVYLTPEVRRGDWLDFTFEVEPESMGRKDSGTRFAQAMDFAVKILPAAASAAQVMVMLGFPFSAKDYIIRMAKDAGIDWMPEVFYDPEFQVRMARLMMMGPQPGKGQAGPSQGSGAGAAAAPPGISQNLLASVLQNNQPGSVADNPGPAERNRAGQQSGAALAQAELKRFGI